MTAHDSTISPFVGRGQFAEATTAAATAVYNSLAELVAAVPGNITKPRQLEQALSIDYKLAWRVFLVLRANDAINVASLIPKPPSIQKLVAAARAAELADGVITNFQKTVDAFEDTVRVQAGSRLAFDSIVTGMAPAEGKEQIDVVERRTAFRTNSHIWGSQANTYICSVLYVMDRKINRLNCVKLGTRLGFKRLRPNAPVIAHAFRPPRSVLETDDETKALDPQVQHRHDAAFLLDFCSKPLPEFKTRTVRDGWVYYELADDAIGQTNAVDLATGTRERRPLDAITDGNSLSVLDGIQFNTPAERLIFDIVIHRPSLGQIQPELIVAAGMAGDKPLASLLEGARFPLRTDFRRLSGGIRAAATPHMPRYVEMLQYACDRVGWNVDDFDLCRAIVQYPILHSTAIMQFKRPAP